MTNSGRVSGFNSSGTSNPWLVGVEQRGVQLAGGELTVDAAHEGAAE